MVNASLKALFSQVTVGTDVKESALVLLNGLVQRMQAAVDFAFTQGVRKTDLDSVQAEVDIWRVATTRFAEAIVANTPDMRFTTVRPYPPTLAEKRFASENSLNKPYGDYVTPLEGRPSDRFVEDARTANERKAKATADEARRLAGLPVQDKTATEKQVERETTDGWGQFPAVKNPETPLDHQNSAEIAADKKAKIEGDVRWPDRAVPARTPAEAKVAASREAEAKRIAAAKSQADAVKAAKKA